MLYLFAFTVGLVAVVTYNHLFIDNVLENYVEKLISNATFKDTSELITGHTGYANNIGVKIFYEDLCSCEKPIATVLLINGSSESLLQWPEIMVSTILKNNFRVIKFDNRGVGMSDWIRNWSKSNSYNLNDMALDALAVTNHLKIDKFHLIGYSMGGMISQILAINYPEKILSITSIMSSGYLFDPEAEMADSVKISQLRKMIWGYRNKERSVKKVLKFHFKLSHIWTGTENCIHNHEKELDKVLYEIKKRNGSVSYTHLRAHET